MALLTTDRSCQLSFFLFEVVQSSVKVLNFTQDKES